MGEIVKMLSLTTEPVHRDIHEANTGPGSEGV